MKNVIRELAERSFQQELIRCRELDAAGQKAHELSEDEIRILSKKIAALPPVLQSILYFHYCFGFSAGDSEEILDTEQAVEQRLYAKKVLSVSMGLAQEVIGDDSLTRACDLAISAELQEMENQAQEMQRKVEKTPL